MTDRAARRIAWGLWLVTIVLSLVTAAFIAISFDAQLPNNWGFRGYGALLAPALATAGAVVASSGRRNAVGWLLCVSGVFSALVSLDQEYASYAVFVRPGSLPAAEVVAWVGAWAWLLFPGTLFYAVLLFPDGRPPSPRWRAVMVVAASSIAGGMFVYGLRPGPLENFSGLPNPFAATGTLEDIRSAAQFLALPLFLVTIGLTAYAPVARYRRSGTVERQQLKWLALAAAVGGVALIATILSPLVAGRSPLSSVTLSGDPAIVKATETLVIVGFLAIPIAIGVAIMRYRLYDIDVLINRALVYGATTAIIAVTFFGGVILLQEILSPLTAGSDVAVAASTLASVALFQPLRRRTQNGIDRRFYRSRYDAARTLDAFSARLRDEVDIDAVRADLVDAVRETVQPTHASVWLR